MNRNNLTTAVIAGIAGVAGIANMASAVNLNPDGLGQVLLYPYYTVNSGQQTLLSVVNTTAVGKAVKVRFLEGYNSREVLDFNLFLSRFDVWTATVFSLSDAGITGDGAAIFTTDKSCTAPAFTQGTIASNGAGYQQFFNFAYNAPTSDTGPTGDDRTREGHFEIISMADIVNPSVLNTRITHVNSVPPGCATAEAEFEAVATDTVPPTGGLFGAASIVNVNQGKYYAFNADAVDGFTAVKLNQATGSLLPNLQQVNDVGNVNATAFVFNNGTLVTASYPVGATAIDAVSALFDASNVYNQYQHAANGSVGSDWVVNMPTKRFYVDPLITGVSSATAPFEQGFGEVLDGLSCDVVGLSIFDREENTTSLPTCGFSPCPPGQPPSSICRETNVLTFAGANSSILGSKLTSNIASPFSAGWLGVSFTDAAHGGTAAATHAHAMNPSNEGTIFYGLPVNGFEAEDFVNGNLTSGGVTVLANYAGVYRHRISRCADTTAAVGACS
jgi:hypothetical protein